MYAATRRRLACYPDAALGRGMHSVMTWEDIAMSEHVPEHDPRSRFEDEGIPDLQDGTPEQQWAVDPQEAPLPGDQPMAADDYGTTVEEQIEDEPLDSRLGREIPEERPAFGADVQDAHAQQAFGAQQAAGDEAMDAGAEDPDLTEDSGLGVGSDLDTSFEPGAGTEEDWPAQPEEPSGQVWDEPRRAGRIVAPGQGSREDAEPDEVAEEVGPDMGGYSAEETAMRVEPE